jgi:hypothetical protein
VPNLKRILRFESFRHLGEDSASLSGARLKGELSLGERPDSFPSKRKMPTARPCCCKVRWGGVRHEYVLQRGGTTVLGGGSSTGKKGEVYAVILVGR